MIGKLKRRFVGFCAASVCIIILLILGFFVSGITMMTQKTMDRYLDAITDNGGILPDQSPRPIFDFNLNENNEDIRYFSVISDTNGQTLAVNLDYISSVTEEEAVALSRIARNKKSARGWLKNFRFKVTTLNDETATVFLDGNVIRGTIKMSFTTMATMLIFFGVVVFIVLTFLSKRFMRPVIESYNKQKQFITDVSHDLKTPITLINTNVEIVESEIGKNEWLEDVKKESMRMTELVNELVTLTKMDEMLAKMQTSVFSLDEVVTDAVSEFKVLCDEKGLKLSAEVEKGVEYDGDISSIRRLIGILLDNAIKYCDDNGEVCVKLTRRRHPVVTVSNTYSDVDKVELDKLFDRFYRADKSRTNRGSFGIGLSIAKSIATAHHGDITCYKKAENEIEFKVTLK